MADLIAPNGAKVKAADDKVDGLLRRGFSRVEEKKPAAKKPSSDKSSK